MFFSAENIQLLLLYTLSGFFGTVGYTLISRMRRKRIVWASLGGALGVIVWFVCFYYSNHIFLSNMAASFFVSVYSEVMARVTKAPSTVYLVPGIIPLVPGGKLYYTMSALVNSDMTAFRANGLEMIEIALGIAVGIVLMSTIFAYLRSKRINKIKGAR